MRNEQPFRCGTPALPRQLAHLYRETNANLRRKDLRVLWEIISTLANDSHRAFLGQKDVLLGHGKEGLAEFQDLLRRPALDPVPASWDEIKWHVGKFHLVKFLRFRLPHSDFRNLRFSLFDFPGLGAGLYRDEHISREFIAEANVILVLIRPGRVGGESVTHILESFAARREQLSPRDMLRRIFFVFNGQPESLPRDETLVKFYLSVCQMVRNYLGLLLNRQPLSDAERRDLLRAHLSHFIAADGQVGGYLRGGDRSSTAEKHRSHYEDNVSRGAFDCPTDHATLRQLAENPRLLNETEGYPILAELLADPLVGKAVAEVFAALKDVAGMPNLLSRLRQFVEVDGPHVQAADVRMHLK